MICYALRNLYLHKEINLQTYNVTKTYIKSLLENQSSVLGWLWNKGVVELGQYNNHSPELLDYRERWIDHMVKELSE